MALSGNTKSEIGFKKAVGVANTQYSNTVARAFNEESIKTAPSLSSFTIFGEEINQNILNGYSGDTNSNVGIGLYYNDNVVEKLRLPLEIDTSTNIGLGQSQAYYAKLPSNYSGITSFSGGTLLKDTLGKLQIVPPLFGNAYDYLLLDTQANVIPKLSSIDWYLDPYNGVLFVQSPPQNFDSNNLRPGFIECFIYAGKMLNEVSSTGSTGGGNAFINNEPYNPNTWSGDTVSGATRQALYNVIRTALTGSSGGGNAFINNEAYNPTTWSGDTVSGATRQALYDKLNFDNNNFINFTASTNSRFNEINTYTSNTQTLINNNNNNFINFTGTTNTNFNNVLTNYITASTNTNGNISILSGKTNNNLIFRTFTGFSGINLNIGPLNETIQISPDYGTGSTQIARGNHTHRPIDLEYPVFSQPVVSGTSIDFNNEITTIQLASNQEITITGFTNFKPGKSVLIYVSGQPITETSPNYYSLIADSFYFGSYVGDVNITGTHPTFTLTFTNNTINNTIITQGNVLKVLNNTNTNNSVLNLTVTTNITGTQISTIVVTANTTGLATGTAIPLINTSGFTNFNSLNIINNRLIYVNQSIYKITSINDSEYRFIINNSISNSNNINLIVYNTNNFLFNIPSLTLITDGEYIAGSNSLIQITCVNTNTFLVSYRNNI